MEILLIILSLVIAAVLFTGWVIFSISRGVLRLLFPKHRAPVAVPANVQRCNNPRCQCDNPTYARYCRRCGKSLPNLLRLVTSRAAIL